MRVLHGPHKVLLTHYSPRYIRFQTGGDEVPQERSTIPYTSKDTKIAWYLRCA